MRGDKMTIEYQANAQDYTARMTADEFARSWFDIPRSIDTWTEITPELYHFTLVNGTATYRVKYIPGVRLVSFPIWEVSRM
jgi:hypothetical protein